MAAPPRHAATRAAEPEGGRGRRTHRHLVHDHRDFIKRSGLRGHASPVRRRSPGSSGGCHTHTNTKEGANERTNERSRRRARDSDADRESEGLSEWRQELKQSRRQRETEGEVTTTNMTVQSAARRRASLSPPLARSLCLPHSRWRLSSSLLSRLAACILPSLLPSPSLSSRLSASV